MSGLRFGVLYTENQHVATAVASLCRYHGLSGLVQHQMAQLLRDHGDCLSGSRGLKEEEEWGWHARRTCWGS